MAKKANAFSAPLTPSAALAEVIGSKPRPRYEVVSALWKYIHKHKLQDKKKKTNLNCDDNFKAVFGNKKQITMFEMNKLIGKHLKK